MKVKVNELLLLLEKRGMSALDFARETGVEVSEIDKLLRGETVGKNTAQAFIYYLGADTAQGLIDWDALGKKNPLACDADNNENLDD